MKFLLSKFSDCIMHTLLRFLFSLQVHGAYPLIRSDSAHKAHMEAPSIEKTQKRIRTVEGISDQVVGDFDMILEKCGHSYYVLMILSELVRVYLRQSHSSLSSI